MIEVKNFSLHYGKKKILHEINYTFTAPITAIVGPSGSGKSSFVLSLNRLVDFYQDVRTEGEINFENCNILAQTGNLRSLRHSIGMVFQKPTPFPVSIYKNLELPLLESAKVPKSEFTLKIEMILKKVELWEEVKNNLHLSSLKLSGGQQQKLCMARALLLEPKMLILDEPCSSLDPVSTLQIEELLKVISLKTKIIIVTHNLKQAKRISERLIVFGLKNGSGSIIEEGTSRDVFQSPVDPFTKNYLEYETF